MEVWGAEGLSTLFCCDLLVLVGQLLDDVWMRERRKRVRRQEDPQGVKV